MTEGWIVQEVRRETRPIKRALILLLEQMEQTQEVKTCIKDLDPHGLIR